MTLFKKAVILLNIEHLQEYPMAIKMAQLMKATGETRSTLLYYVKEGLLSEPSKPKPNVHLYADDSIERVRLIKTLQHQLHYSISQIKQVFDDNQFDFENGVEVLTQKLDLLSGVKERRYKSIEEALEVYTLSKEQLEEYISLGVLEVYEGYLSDQSWKMLQILDDLSQYEQAQRLLKAYLDTARSLAVLEYELGAVLIERDDKGSNHAQELFLDLVLSFKPYIFNLQTKNEHKRRVNA